MCGIAGFLTAAGAEAENASGILRRMTGCIAHRGPDDSGEWIDSRVGIFLGHRRLAILDLSAAGHQPMQSASERYVIVFNGEIYNHLDLRRKLAAEAKSPAWRGHSDTETLLAGIETWGVKGAVEASVGMFAFALWDRKDRILTLARDRLGEKPLYYGWQQNVFLFGSELKALRAHPAWNAEIALDVLPIYLRHGYIPAPHCIWRGMYKVQPGTLINLRAMELRAPPEIVPYWTLDQAIAAGARARFMGDENEAVNALESRLMRAVGGQMVADVPLGAFLSGGIDSTTVVALMQAQSQRPVKTFTLGFEQAAYNEAPHAKLIARHLGTEHTELYIPASIAQNITSRLPEIYDEPLGDSSAIPTRIVSELARSSVSVALSGDGGDEIFGGYSRYFNAKAEHIWRAMRALPTPIRRFLRESARGRITGWLDRHLPSARVRSRPFARSIRARAELVTALSDCDSVFDYYRTLTSQWNPVPIPRHPIVLPYGPDQAVTDSVSTSVEKMMVIDTLTYLPDDIMVKVDRAAMSVSLETRIPLLDHRLVEFAWSLPLEYKVRSGTGKWILRRVLSKFVPPELFDRPKKGFAVPVDEWIRGPMRDWAETLLAESRIRNDGFFAAQEIRRRWHEHLTGQCNWRDSLWIVLMFQAWLEMNRQPVA